MKVLLKQPDCVRIEQPTGQVAISRRGELKSLLLDPLKKTALVLEVKKGNRPQEARASDPALFAEELRKLVDKEGRPIGRKRIGAIEAQGFRVDKVPSEPYAREGKVWADPKTKLPLLAEINLPQNIRATLSDFRIDPPADDALFSMKPPEGYRLETMSVENLTPEESLVHLLREYALTAKGEFPPRLDDLAALGKHFRKARGDKSAEKPGPDEMQRILNVARVNMALSAELKDYGYKPDGIRLGDAGKILFRHRPAGAEKRSCVVRRLRTARRPHRRPAG